MKFINKMIIKYVANIFDILKYVIVFKKIFALFFFHLKLYSLKIMTVNMIDI